MFAVRSEFAFRASGGMLSGPVKVINRILLTRLLKAVDEKLTEQQAGFGKDRACTDQIAALRIIIKQSLESTKLRNKEVFHFVFPYVTVDFVKFVCCLGLLSEPLVEYYLDLNLWLFSTS
jgi:hypothetical protein